VAYHIYQVQRNLKQAQELKFRTESFTSHKCGIVDVLFRDFDHDRKSRLPYGPIEEKFICRELDLFCHSGESQLDMTTREHIHIRK